MAEALSLALEGFRDYLAGLTSGGSALLQQVFWQSEVDVKKPLTYPAAILRVRGMRPHLQGTESLVYVDIAMELRVHSPTRDSEGDILGDDRATPDSTTPIHMGLARLSETLIRATHYVNRSHNAAIIPCIRFRSASQIMRMGPYATMELTYEGLLAISDTSLSTISWTTQPPDTTGATIFIPNPVVTSTDTGFTGNVTVALIDSGGVGATLSGTLTQAAVAGVATFDDLEVNLNGTYRLRASASGYSSVLSDEFTISGLP